jgi:hypothetical protein
VHSGEFVQGNGWVAKKLGAPSNILHVGHLNFGANVQPMDRLHERDRLTHVTPRKLDDPLHGWRLAPEC